MDSCHVDNPELYYCVYMHESSSCGPRTVYQVVPQLCFLSLAAVPTWLFIVFVLSTVGVANCQIENVIC